MSLSQRVSLHNLPLRVRVVLIIALIYTAVFLCLAVVFFIFYRHYTLSSYREDWSATLTTRNWSEIASQAGKPFSRLSIAARRSDTGIEWVGDELNDDQEQNLRTAIEGIDAPDYGIHNTYFYTAVRKPDETLIAFTSAAQFSNQLSILVRLALFSLLAGLVSVTVASWIIAGFATRPIRQLQEFAEELSADNLTSDIEFEDATPEIEQLNNELAAALKRIEAGYEEQARFLANVSHELKTPISVTLTEAQVLLTSDPSESELRTFAESTAQEMSRLGKIVESFLQLSRVNKGKSRLKQTRLEANFLVMDSFENCQAMARQYGITITPRLLESDSSVTVTGSRDLLHTAIDNLIRNAIRFSPKDQPVELTVQLVHASLDAPQPTSRVQICVRDYGPGVPDEIATRIFEPYTQASDERRHNRGSGLGLQIAQGIAEMHEGHISVKNLDQGCQFTLELPASVYENPQDEESFIQDSASDQPS